MRLAGVVLAGGAGRRLGADKALVVVRGRTLVERAVEALVAAGADPVVVVGGDPDRLMGLTAGGRPLDGLADPPPAGRGPLVGLATGLAASPSWVDAVVALPVDLAHPDPDVVRALAAGLVDAGADVAVAVSGGRRHPTTAAWSPRATRPVAAALAAGARSLHDGVHAAGRATEVELPDGAIADVDTPADLEALRRPTGGGDPGSGPLAAPVASGPDAPRRGDPERRPVPDPHIDVHELRRGRDGGSTTLVDVRCRHEHAAGHVPGARCVPLGELADRAGDLPSGPVHVICHVGPRARVAATWLRERGIDALAVGGGTRAWRHHGLPLRTGPTP